MDTQGYKWARALLAMSCIGVFTSIAGNCTKTVRDTTCVKEGTTKEYSGLHNRCLTTRTYSNATSGFDRCDSEEDSGRTDCGDEGGKSPHKCEYDYTRIYECQNPYEYSFFSKHYSYNKADQIAIGDECPSTY